MTTSVPPSPGDDPLPAASAPTEAGAPAPTEAGAPAPVEPEATDPSAVTVARRIRRVEVIKGPPRETLIHRFRAETPFAIVTALLTAVFTTLALGLLAPDISAYVSLANPTCDNTRGLRPVGAGAITASGPYEKGFEPRKALDGSTGTLWAPVPLSRERREPWMSRGDVVFFDPAASTLTLDFHQDRNIALVCVVNGLANSYTFYVNWARVRTVETWSDDDRGTAHVSVLQSQDAGSFQNLQAIDVPKGAMTTLHIRLVDAYQGQEVTSVDPDRCGTRNKIGPGKQNDPIGCTLNATPRAGISEVVVYERHWRLTDLIPGS